MRNFWLEGQIEGRKSMVTGGPTTKEGTMRVDIKVKEKGKSVTALTIVCIPDINLNLNNIQIFNGAGTLLQCMIFDIKEVK